MSFASFVDRARNEFIGTPGLELSLPQAVRLWNLGADDCRYVLDALVDAGFLAWTPQRTITRTGRELHLGPKAKAHISVRKSPPADKSVGA